ncbi:YgjP-like metallopeptidase domain-containing protein [Nitrosococcus watsonii]|uniref:YgjP-like metallopeptidase domain-containing protein n=1 Tax=Nitrosococcus watsonii TaxID=473531 RepID=UPI001E4D1FE3|nr:YgjP-like metallopeptidase domain-containing protein [Nitrosococcus watsonii]
MKEPVELPYLRVANVQDGHLLLDEIKIIQLERSKVSCYSLKKGDVLLTEGGGFEPVLMHELCHLRHHHHGPEFYQLLDRSLPDWMKRKHTLEMALA